MKLTMTALLRDTDVMADVLAFLPRKMIALQLARVNRRFSALCNCWCQPKEEAAENDDGGSFKNGQQHRKRNRNQVSKSKKRTVCQFFKVFINKPIKLSSPTKLIQDPAILICQRLQERYN